jgi:hypothetical protein
MSVPPEVTVTLAAVSEMLRWVCTDQPVADSVRVPDPWGDVQRVFHNLG